jgi:hypothetical protein
MVGPHADGSVGRAVHVFYWGDAKPTTRRRTGRSVAVELNDRRDRRADALTSLNVDPTGSGSTSTTDAAGAEQHDSR